MSVRQYFWCAFHKICLTLLLALYSHGAFASPGNGIYQNPQSPCVVHITWPDAIAVSIPGQCNRYGEYNGVDTLTFNANLGFGMAEFSIHSTFVKNIPTGKTTISSSGNFSFDGFMYPDGRAVGHTVFASGNLFSGEVRYQTVWTGRVERLTGANRGIEFYEEGTRVSTLSQRAQVLVTSIAGLVRDKYEEQAGALPNASATQPEGSSLLPSMAAITTEMATIDVNGSFCLAELPINDYVIKGKFGGKCTRGYYDGSANISLTPKTDPTLPNINASIRFKQGKITSPAKLSFPNERSTFKGTLKDFSLYNGNIEKPINDSTIEVAVVQAGQLVSVSERANDKITGKAIGFAILRAFARAARDCAQGGCEADFARLREKDERRKFERKQEQDRATEQQALDVQQGIAIRQQERDAQARLDAETAEAQRRGLATIEDAKAKQLAGLDRDGNPLPAAAPFPVPVVPTRAPEVQVAAIDPPQVFIANTNPPEFTGSTQPPAPVPPPVNHSEPSVPAPIIRSEPATQDVSSNQGEVTQPISGTAPQGSDQPSVVGSSAAPTVTLPEPIPPLPSGTEPASPVVSQSGLPAPIVGARPSVDPLPPAVRNPDPLPFPSGQQNVTRNDTGLPGPVQPPSQNGVASPGYQQPAPVDVLPTPSPPSPILAGNATSGAGNGNIGGGQPSALPSQPTNTSTRVIPASTSLAVPIAPTSLFPTNQGELAQPITLSWNAVPIATYYILAVHNLTNGAFPYDDVRASTNQYQIGSLPMASQFAWDVQACNFAGCSGRSGNQRFLTGGGIASNSANTGLISGAAKAAFDANYECAKGIASRTGQTAESLYQWVSGLSWQGVISGTASGLRSFWNHPWIATKAVVSGLWNGGLAGAKSSYQQFVGTVSTSYQPNQAFQLCSDATAAAITTVNAVDGAKEVVGAARGGFSALKQIIDRPIMLGDELESAATQPAGLRYVFYNATTVYRGDTRGVSTIFTSGFVSRGTSTDLISYVKDNIASIFIGSSKSRGAATKFAGLTGYVYEIDATKLRGVDVNATIGPHTYTPEWEVVFEGSVPTTAIKGAWQILPGGLYGKYISNMNYK